MNDPHKTLLLGFVAGVYLSIGIALMIVLGPGPTVEQWCTELLETSEG